MCFFVQRCLQRLGPIDSQFIYDAAGQHTAEIAMHRCVLESVCSCVLESLTGPNLLLLLRHGCCVLQRCIDFATPQQKTDLVQHIAACALVLSQVGERNHIHFSSDWQTQNGEKKHEHMLQSHSFISFWLLQRNLWPLNMPQLLACEAWPLADFFCLAFHTIPYHSIPFYFLVFFYLA